MKKVLPLVLTICALFMTGCGSEEESAPEKIRVGTIRYLNVTEDALIKSHGQTDKLRQSPAKYEQVFFDNMNSMVFALLSGDIDEMSTYETVGNYLVKVRPDLECSLTVPDVKDNFCCAMREEDVALKKEFDDAIAKLSADGTLVHLVKQYLADVDYNSTPKIIHMPYVKGAPTIKVAVTGDLPLLDYMRPDGMPAGFNTAILAEISKIIGKNFQPVEVNSGARAAALASKKVDVIFWAVVPTGKRDLPPDFDKPAGVIMTVPYFSDNIVHIRLKNEVTE